jgi:hypothetical protein
LITGAIIDPTEQYRYSLWRIWDESAPRMAFMMFNPSTADEQYDDQTIKRCIGFAKGWGFGSLEVINLFAYRATDPKELKQVNNPVGPDNDSHILEAIERVDRVVLAWGTNGVYQKRNEKVLRLLSGYENLYALELTKASHPKHPLFVRADIAPIHLQVSLSPRVKLIKSVTVF